MLRRENQVELSIASIFEHPTLRAMTSLVLGKGGTTPESRTPTRVIAAAQASTGSIPSSAIAIIGMTGRFPGADSVEEFWANLAAGVESITFFDREQLEASSARPPAAPRTTWRRARFSNDADNVRCRLLRDLSERGRADGSAASRFPGVRLGGAGARRIRSRPHRQSVGVFAGCSMNTYFMQNLATGREFLEDFTGSYQVGYYVTMLGNDKDFLPTRVSYKLNLRGPSMTVQTACSTSLVAVCQACQSLLDGRLRHGPGGSRLDHLPAAARISSAGGRAGLARRTLPALRPRANGTVFGSGRGRASAQASGRGGRRRRPGSGSHPRLRGQQRWLGKVGYTAPSVEGQAQVIARAQKMAGVPAESITYLEAHGTGTPLGDPIEVAGLNKAFRASTPETNFCSLGTAKANVGHLDVAAGATGLIKTVLQIQHRAIPGLLHFEQPNPHLELANSPFFFSRRSSRGRRTGPAARGRERLWRRRHQRARHCRRATAASEPRMRGASTSFSSGRRRRPRRWQPHAIAGQPLIE